MAVTKNVAKLFYSLFLINLVCECAANDILGCGGFVKSHVSLDFSKIEIGLYTKEGSLKEKTECAPTNGYYFLPLYEKGEYVLKVHPPAGWSFEPSKFDLVVDGVTDQCSTGQDINFSFNGFGIAGRVITAGQKDGPSGVTVQLVNDRGEVRNTVTATGGDFHFTPVIPGKYTVKTSHPRWKLEPSEAVVQVKEGNTALPSGILAVKGYDVKGSVTSNGNPINGLYVLLYSKDDNPKYRVEGCKTALLQGVPDSPICYSVTDASGEFSFGLVPAGEYRLMALAKPPGQATVTFNVRPEYVSFSVRHDSLYIKNAFEVSGFVVSGSLREAVSGVQVLVDGVAVASTDAAGKYTLPSLQPGLYEVSFQHDKCEISSTELRISARSGVTIGAGAVSRWRVCGAVTPPVGRVLLTRNAEPPRPVDIDNTGKWCTFLPPGVYTAKVEVSEREQKEGLQFYPEIQKVSVGNGPVDGITFSQLKGTVEGRVKCLEARACDKVEVTLRMLGSDGYIGKPITVTTKDGAYKFPEVSAGRVEVSVPTSRLCWQTDRHSLSVSQPTAVAPDFVHTGYVLNIHTTHDIEVNWSGSGASGTWHVPAGGSAVCASARGVYSLVPRSCHTLQPATATVDTTPDTPPTVSFVAIAHASVIQVISPVAVDDLMLSIDQDGKGSQEIGPLKPKTQSDGGPFIYEHTLQLADGELCVVSASSGLLLFSPSEPQQLVGASSCRALALVLHARAGLVRAGRIVPPVADVLVTLTSDGVKLSQVTSSDGTYRFGPLDASLDYVLTAEKESYVFTAPDDNGNILAHKLAEITVELIDDADGTPLQGALVSVSGGSYRRTLGAGADATLRFPSLAPHTYYVKPLMKEYRFTPKHHIIDVQEGRTHHVTLKGVRVAWSCVGSVVSLGGVGRSPVTVLATPTPSSARSDPAGQCATEEATTEPSGAFRIRGLVPGCVYTLQLKESSIPELVGLKLVKSPGLIEVKDNKDIDNVRLIAIQPHQITDANVLVYTPNVDHYKTLRLSLATENSPHSPIYSTKLDPAGYNNNLNPGLMYVLPRLPADNNTYILQLESSLSKTTHSYEEPVYYFTSDGSFKHFDIDFVPKVKSSEVELRQSSFIALPLLLALAAAWWRRDLLLNLLADLLAPRIRPTRSDRPDRPDRPDLLDKASIEHILSTVNAAGKRTAKKKVQ